MTPFPEISVFATYQRQQTMLQAKTRLNFEVEMQYKAATNGTNSRVLEKNMGFWVGEA